jgi:hypothetical protein
MSIHRRARRAARIKTNSEIATIIAAVEAAKNGGDYATANILFAAGLHVALRGGKLLGDPRTIARHFVLECEDIEADWERECSNPLVAEPFYYDLLHVVDIGMHAHTCIPVPMIRTELCAQVYAHAPRVERGAHCRFTIPTLPDTWSAEHYGYLSMGEEAVEMWFSEHGHEELSWLRGRRVGGMIDTDEADQ